MSPGCLFALRRPNTCVHFLIDLKKGISLGMAWMEMHIQQKLFNDLLHFFVKGNIFLC